MQAMNTVITEITITVPPQTAWSIVDDLDGYPEWNKVLPEATGSTTIGQTLNTNTRSVVVF
jgi:hypothetical protein